MNVRLRDHVTATPTEYGLVLLDEDGGEYWSLNGTGALVLRAMLDGEDGARALATEYGVDRAAAADDVAALLAELRGAGLIAR